MGTLASQIFFLEQFFNTPLVGSAGTVGYGSDFLDMEPRAEECFGGLTLKTITPKPQVGNPSPRVCETESGFINSIGLQNCGLNDFINKVHPRLGEIKSRVIASVAAFTIKDFVKMVSQVSRLEYVDMVEMNVSCPNTDYHGKDFSSDEILLKEVISACSQEKHAPLLVKLSPMHHAVKMARVAEEAGANALTVSNTFTGMRIDIQERKPMIATGVGGYSGPAVKPIVLSLVYQITQAVSLPVIGVGGVTTWHDVVEYLLAGASLVGIGTANFTHPRGGCRIWKGFKRYLDNYQLTASNLVGALKLH